MSGGAPIVLAEGLSKHFRVAEKPPGLGGTLRHLLRRRYRDVAAVQEVSFAIEPGEMVGFLGPNGAGKTTTMNVLLGFVRPTSGTARLFGVDVREPIARQRIGYLPELTYYYKFLTAEELLRFYARIFQIPNAETDRRIDQLMKLVELEPARKQIGRAHV